MLILCKENDKYKSRKPKYYILKIEANKHILNCLELRSRINPELEYYTTRLDESLSQEEILILFKSRTYRKEPDFVKI